MNKHTNLLLQPGPSELYIPEQAIYKYSNMVESPFNMMLGARCLRKQKVLFHSIYIKFWKIQINLSCQNEISDFLGMG